MVWFESQPQSQPQPQPQPQPEVEDARFKNPKEPFEISDDQATDFSFADSFINFDYIPDFFEDKPVPDMAAPDNNVVAVAFPPNGSDPNSVGSTHPVKVEGPECENSGTLDLGIAIEEGMEKISLVGSCGTSVGIGGNCDVNANDEDEDQSESSESVSANASSSSSSTSCPSSSSSSSSSDSDDDDDGEQKEEKREGQARRVADVEVEEGEIIDSDGQELVTETAAIDDDDDDDSEEDAEKMASWDIVNDDDVGDDDDDGHNATGRPIRSKNELEILPSVPPVNVTLEPHHQMLPVGVVMSILGSQVIVEGMEKHDPLNEGSILWITESRTPLGLIDEIFGPVKNPYYVVRYNSENEVPAGIHGGTSISFVPEFANHVLNNKDLYKKGYDASGVNDEEASDEPDFSDDEKEAEYKRMQRMTKRGINNQNPAKRKNNRKKVPPKEGVVPTFPAAPATQLLDHGHCSPFSGIGQGHFGATTVVPPFPPTNARPNATTSGVWTNGTTLPQPQSAMLPNGFPTNGVSWYTGNTQISHQLPVPGIPFQRQLNPSHGFPSTTVFPGVQPNIFAQPMYPQGFLGQNQMAFGLSSPFPHIQPPVWTGPGQQGFLSSELQSETNRNLHSSSIPGNPHAAHLFNPGASASRGRKTFHRGGRKGWRPAK